MPTEDSLADGLVKPVDDQLDLIGKGQPMDAMPSDSNPTDSLDTKEPSKTEADITDENKSNVCSSGRNDFSSNVDDNSNCLVQGSIACAAEQPSNEMDASKIETTVAGNTNAQSDAMPLEKPVETTKIAAPGCESEVQKDSLLLEDSKVGVDDTVGNAMSFEALEAIPKTSAEKPCDKLESVYFLKQFKWSGENIQIVTQNENGPCPLLAIANVLVLSKRITLPPMQECITASQLMEYIGDYILTAGPRVGCCCYSSGIVLILYSM